MARSNLYCYLCHREIEDVTKEGGEVEFADFYQPPPEPLFIDGIIGMEWFCDEHLKAAQALSHLPHKEALIKLQEQYGVFPEIVEPEVTYAPSPLDRLIAWFKR